MPSIINATTTNGVAVSGDNSGALALQTNNGTTAVTIDGSQRVGIGGTPQTSFTGWNNLFLGANNQLSSDANSIQIQANTYLNTAGTNWIYSSTAAASRLAVGSSITFNQAASGTAGTNITWTQTLGIEPGKTLALQGASSQSGTGITFPATQSASSDANTLDDYEEGTWTPTIGGGATFTSVGNYTKIGRMVSVNMYIDCTNWGSLSGTLGITGLPFTAGSIQTVGAGREDFATGAMLEMLVQPNLTLINCLAYNNATIIPGGANRRIISASAVYFV